MIIGSARTCFHRSFLQVCFISFQLFSSYFVFLCSSFGRYCLADDRLLDAVKFLDVGDGAGWELLQV